MIKVRDLIAVSQLSLRVRACHRGVDTWIRWAQIADDLDSVGRLQGGQMILTTGRWRHSPVDGDRYVWALAQRGNPVLAMPGVVDGAIPAEIVLACERSRVVLIEVLPSTTCEEAAEVLHRRNPQPRPPRALPRNLDLRRRTRHSALLVLGLHPPRSRLPLRAKQLTASLRHRPWLTAAAMITREG